MNSNFGRFAAVFLPLMGTLACGGGSDNPGSAGAGTGAQSGSGAAGQPSASGAGGNTGGVGGDANNRAGAAGVANGGQGGAGPAVTPRLGRISVGHNHACGLDRTGTPVCWGGIDSGPGTPGNVLIAAGGESACVIDATQKLVCWGELHTAADGTFTDVAVTGVNDACAVKAGGGVLCFGAHVSAWTPPSDVTHGLTAASTFACGLRADETIACWGGLKVTVPDGTFVQALAYGPTLCTLSADGTGSCQAVGGAKPVSTPSGKTFVQLVGGDLTSDYTCGLESDGSGLCWGQTASVAAAPSGIFVALAGGDDAVCGLRPDGSATCWGSLANNMPPGTFRAF